MALNGDLDMVLENIIGNVAPVIKLTNGLYTTIQKNTTFPDINFGTNLFGRIDYTCTTEDDIINAFKLIGTYSEAYSYDDVSNTWSINYIL